jgi:hypothetical protein
MHASRLDAGHRTDRWVREGEPLRARVGQLTAVAPAGLQLNMAMTSTMASATAAAGATTLITLLAR